MALETSEQLRAARAMLRMEQDQLAEAAGVSVGAISRLERLDGGLAARLETVRKLQRALEAAGVEFTARGVELRQAGGAGGPVDGDGGDRGGP